LRPRPHLPSIRTAAVFVSASLLLSTAALIGCGRPSDSGTTSNSTPKSDAGKADQGRTFRVALITPGPVSDNGWNAGAYKGLQDIKAQLGAETQNVEAKTPGEQEENLRDFARKGFNVVIGNGHEFEKPALAMETEFPKTMFVISSGEKTGNNTTPIVLQLEDGAYLEGMLAAGISKTGKIASVGAEKSPPLESVFKAFAAGARAVNPQITLVLPVYTGDWEDVGKAKGQTNALLDQGADVIIQDLDAGAQGVFQAVQERSRSGKTVYALGTNSDQNAIAPDVILASAPIDLSRAFVPIVQQIKEGTFKPNTTPYGMKSGVIGFVLNPKLETKIPAPLMQKLDEARKKILDGSLSPAQKGGR
jgi:basic membrane protein A